MTELCFTDNNKLYDKVIRLSARHTDAPIKILRTQNGKPYIDGNPVYFSLSHSGERALIALSDSPVGADAEIVTGKVRKSVLARFSAEEREEIADADAFLRHWVVREAYVKMLGSTLAEKLRALEYVRGNLYDEGKKVDCGLFFGRKNDLIFCVCTKGAYLPVITVDI